MRNKTLVLDANILIQAVLGNRVCSTIETYAEEVSFIVLKLAYSDAEQYLVALVIKRGGNPDKALALLRALAEVVNLVGAEMYSEFEYEARDRLGERDPEDWRYPRVKIRLMSL